MLAHCEKNETPAPEQAPEEPEKTEAVLPAEAEETVVSVEEQTPGPEEAAEDINLDAIEAFLRAQAEEDVNSAENRFMERYRDVLEKIDHNPDYVLFIANENSGLKEEVLVSKLQQAGFCIESGMRYSGQYGEGPPFKKALIINTDEEESIKTADMDVEFKAPTGYGRDGE